MAKVSPFRFSTKSQDDETDLLYYGYRYYNASTARWMSRDPMDEKDTPNLYCFIANRPVLGVDALGLWLIYDKVTKGELLDWYFEGRQFIDSLVQSLPQGRPRQIATDFVESLNIAKSQLSIWSYSGT